MSAKSVCFGAVEWVRRRWVTKVGGVGHWIYQAGVRDFSGVHIVSISQRYFGMLRRRGAKRTADVCRHPTIGMKPPTKTVQG